VPEYACGSNSGGLTKGYDCLQGVIIKGIGGFYYVRAENGRTYECKARGIFRKENIKPIIGDRVEISRIDEEHGSIDSIFTRINSLIRPPVANIDAIVIVAAAKNPDPDFYLTDKLLLMAEIKGITPALCVNKTDLESSEKIKEVYRHSSYPVFDVCAAENLLPDGLIEFISGKTTAFAGLSGVGKSSILNLIVDNAVETGGISEKIGRGKHTTRHVELFELKSGGYVLDTPGFSAFEPDIIDAADLCGYFPEMREYSDCCRFRGCAHIAEPGCAVKEALSEGKISPERYQSYTKMYEVLKNHKKWEV